MCRRLLPLCPGGPWLKGFPWLLRDPDSVVLCVLAADDAADVALQIHFTLLQSFCCESGLTILRVSGLRRLQQLLGSTDANRNQEEHRDLHCMLVTVSRRTPGSARSPWKHVCCTLMHVSSLLKWFCVQFLYRTHRLTTAGSRK